MDRGAWQATVRGVTESDTTEAHEREREVYDKKHKNVVSSLL